jgi:hypothetical protein
MVPNTFGLRHCEDLGCKRKAYIEGKIYGEKLFGQSEIIRSFEFRNGVVKLK